jgi:hypothetical protein
MIRLDTSHPDRATVSNPGVIRNFRVQVREGGASEWRMYGTFRRRSDAEACVASQMGKGLSARVIDCDRCPTPM